MASYCARYEGQVAAITGGAQGIGFGIAQRLGREGATVILLDMNGDALDSAREALEKESIKAATFQLNVTDAAQVTKVFEEIVAQHKQLDVLVQSAGVTGKTGIKTEEVDPKNFQFVFDVNVNGVFLCCQAALRHMTKRQYGRIINIGRQQELIRERSYFCFFCLRCIEASCLYLSAFLAVLLSVLLFVHVHLRNSQPPCRVRKETPGCWHILRPRLL